VHSRSCGATARCWHLCAPKPRGRLARCRTGRRSSDDRNLRRPTRSQIARRRGAVTVIVIVGLIGLWQFWPSGGTEGAAGPGPSGSANPVSPTTSASASIKPNANPIQHVIFLVKENHSFDNYFGRYPGAGRRDARQDAAV
jgi:hypothetical protein